MAKESTPGGAVWRALQEEISDLDADHLARLVLRLAVAALLGGLIGYERRQAGKDAGPRTHMLVAVGSALFVVIPQQAGMPVADVSRVIQGLVAGIGFIGGGAILKSPEQGRVQGLTSAAGIWLVAAIGVAAGMGRIASAVVATLMAYVIMSVLMRLEAGAPPRPPPPSAPDAD